MKMMCDCGNEMEFSTKDEDTGEETEYTEDEGQYAIVDAETGLEIDVEVEGVS